MIPLAAREFIASRTLENGQTLNKYTHVSTYPSPAVCRFISSASKCAYGVLPGSCVLDSNVCRT